MARHVDALAVLALIALQLGFWWRAALLRGFLVHSDICYQFEPYKKLLHEALRNGRLALWSPYMFCGYPIAAEGQISSFSPVSLLISWLLPSPAAINWLIITHLMIAGVSTYLLARLLGRKPFAAWLAAVVLSFSGYLFAHIHHVGLVCTGAWLPLVLLFVARAWRGPLTPNAALAALAIGAAALSGHPQTLFHIMLAVLLLVAWRLGQAVRDRSPRAYRRAALIIVLPFALGLGTAAVQLLLTADLSASAPHGETGKLSYVTSFSLLPIHLKGLLAPNWQGTPAYNTYEGDPYYWEFVLYIGLAPLLLALVGSVTRVGRPLTALALLALVLALAEGNPLYHVLRFLPGFAHFRSPARFVYLFTLAAALLTACGWETVVRSRVLAHRPRRLAVAGFVALGTILDLFLFDRTLAPLGGSQVYAETPKVVDVLQADEEWGRCFVAPPITIWADWLPHGGWARNPDGYLECRVYLPADVPQSYGLRMTAGYAGFTDPRHAVFFESASARAFEDHDYRLYSLVGTRYFVVAPGMRLSGLPVADLPPFAVYRNPNAFPRAFAIGDVIAATDSSDAYLKTVELAETDRLRGAAAVLGDLEGFAPEAGPDVRLDIEEPRPEHVLITARSDRDALLVLNERWNSGWRALVDGESAPLVEVDTVLMGAPLPAGKHTVEFLYRPASLVVGRAISLASVLLCIALIVGPSMLRRRADSRPAS
jgi:hypothetical protein